MPPLPPPGQQRQQPSNLLLYYADAYAAFARAVAFDEQRDSVKAISAYGDAAELALLGLRKDPLGSSRKAMVKRIGEWISRAEKLKADAELSRSFSSLPDEPPRPLEFRNVQGLDYVKQVLQQAIVLPQLQPQIFSSATKGGLKPWRSILLFGPPGTGKSEIAQAVADESNCDFIALTMADVMSKSFGQSEKNIRLAFEQARASSKPRCIVFLDEIDALGQSRARNSGSSNDEASRRVLTELLAQLDGVGRDNNRLLVLAATNRPMDLDPALRRRFERKIMVPLPAVHDRAMLLAKFLGGPNDHALSPSDVAMLASKTQGLSGSDLKSLANNILMRPVRACLRATHFVVDSRDGTLIPCSPSTPNAKAMRMLDPSFPAQDLCVPLATHRDASEELARCRASVSPGELAGIEAFQNEFGEPLALVEEAKQRESLETLVRKVWAQGEAAAPPSSLAQFLVEALPTQMRQLVGF